MEGRTSSLHCPTPFPLSCQFPPDSPHLQHFLSLGLPDPHLLCFLLSAVIPARNCTLQLSFHLSARKLPMLSSPGMLTGRADAAQSVCILPGAAVIRGERMGLGPLKLGDVSCRLTHRSLWLLSGASSWKHLCSENSKAEWTVPTAGTVPNATVALLLMTSSKDTGCLFSQSTNIS